MALDRDDIIEGLRELVHALRNQNESAVIRIVGGAALALRYYDRATTVDVDASVRPEERVSEFAREIAARHDWPADWLNTKATMFLPPMRDEWVTIWEDAGISISVGAPRFLLAMKLNAARPGRDERDIAYLLAICGVGSPLEAAELFEEYYPGEMLKERAERMIQTVFATGLPNPTAPFPEIDLS